ncbi:reverse transcriptase domain-containing protein [Tanacetum coccineum]
MFQFATIKLMLFPFSIEGAARIWLEKEPPRSIQTWDDLVSKFINQFFPPSKTTNLRNEITRFQQRFDESFYEAWDRFNDLLRACPHHGFSELHQLDTFYNALNINDQDSLNSAAGGNFLDKMPRECLKIIESKSKVRQTRAKAVVAKVSTNSSTQAVSSDVAELKDIVRALLLDKKNQASAPAPAPAPVKAVELSCVTCGGAHSHQNCPATHGNVYRDNDLKWFQIILDLQNQLHRPQVNQSPAYQAPVPQTHSVTKNDFDNYVKANDAIMRNMQNNLQNQGQSMQIETNKLNNQMANLTDMLAKFVTANTASTSGSGTLPGPPIIYFLVVEANSRGDKWTKLHTFLSQNVPHPSTSWEVGKRAKLCEAKTLTLPCMTSESWDVEEKSALGKGAKQFLQRALAWKLSGHSGYQPKFLYPQDSYGRGLCTRVQHKEE